VYVPVESPKGEKGYYLVSDGTAKPVRWRIRPPSFVNLSAIPKMVEGTCSPTSSRSTRASTS
jgi:NADH-quinone oxidoreductase subunit D